MKKLFFFQKLYVLFCTMQACGFLQSCKDQTGNNVGVAPSTTFNFMTFQTAADYQATAEKMNIASYSELEAYQKQNNFISMRMLLKQAESQDAQNHEEEMKLLAKNPALAKTMTHKVPDIITQNPRTFFYSPEEGIELNLTSTELSSVLNKDGIVKVAGKIMQYSKYDVKVIEDGKPEKIALLAKTTQTNKEQGITVNPINFRSSGQKNGKVAYSYTRSCEACTGSPCEYRIIVYEQAYDMTDGVLRYWVGRYLVRTLRRGAFGSWRNHATRSQQGFVNNTSMVFQNYPHPFPIWANGPHGLIPTTGQSNYPFNNSDSDGYETSEYVKVFFNFVRDLTSGVNPPFRDFQVTFSPSTTSNFIFGTGGPACNCSIP
jgi:hypothetical protein